MLVNIDNEILKKQFNQFDFTNCRLISFESNLNSICFRWYLESNLINFKVIEDNNVKDFDYLILDQKFITKEMNKLFVESGFTNVNLICLDYIINGNNLDVVLKNESGQIEISFAFNNIEYTIFDIAFTEELFSNNSNIFKKKYLCNYLPIKD